MKETLLLTINIIERKCTEIKILEKKALLTLNKYLKRWFLEMAKVYVFLLYSNELMVIIRSMTSTKLNSRFYGEFNLNNQI